MYRWAELPPATGDMTFANFQGDGFAAQARKAAQAVAEKCIGGVTLMGPSGTGKTHLAIAAVRRRLEMSVEEHDSSLARVAKYIYVPEFLDFLRRSYNAETELQYDRLFELYKTVGLLALDDVGVENPTPWALEKLDMIIDFRWLRKSATIATTNLTAEQFEKRGQMRLVDRIMDTRHGWQVIHLQSASARSGIQW